MWDMGDGSALEILVRLSVDGCTFRGNRNEGPFQSHESQKLGSFHFAPLFAERKPRYYRSASKQPHN